jgi:hypothetical protein
MNINLDEIMTPAEHLAVLDVPDARVDYAVDQREAMAAEIDGFFARYLAERNGCAWQLLLPSFLPEVREKRCGDFMEDYRAVFASECDLAYGEHIDTEPLTGVTRDPRGKVGLPVNVPIAVFRDQTTFHRVFCWGEVTLDAVLTELEKPRRITDMNDPRFGKRLPDPGCDLCVLPESVHAMTKSLPGMGADGIWPIAHGDFVIFLRYCSPCIGALFDKYKIGKCSVVNPWERIG